MTELEKKYFDIFQFKEDSIITEEVVLVKYRELAKKYHPDVNKDDNGEKMALLNEARAFLISNIKKYEKLELEFEYKNKKIIDILDQILKVQEAFFSEKTVAVDEKIFNINYDKFYDIMAKTILNHLLEFQVPENLLFSYGSIIINNFSKTVGRTISLVMSLMLAYLVNLLKFSKYTDEEINNVLSLSSDENIDSRLNWLYMSNEIYVLFKTGSSVDGGQIGNILSKPLLVEIQKDSTSTYVRNYIASVIINSLKSFSFKLKYSPNSFKPKRAAGSTGSVPKEYQKKLEYDLYNYRSFILYFSPEYMKYFDEQYRNNSELKTKFYSMLENGTARDFCFNELNDLCVNEIKTIINDKSINLIPASRLLGAAYVVNSFLILYLKAINTPSNIVFNLRSNSIDPYDIAVKYAGTNSMIVDKFVELALFDKDVNELNKHLELILNTVYSNSHGSILPKESFNDNCNRKEKINELNNKLNQKNNSGGCYVATCVYGSYDCPEVWRLRRYRDFYLDYHWWGRMFIKTYYLISPMLVKIFGNRKWFKNFFKKILDKKIVKLEKYGYSDTRYFDKY